MLCIQSRRIRTYKYTSLQTYARPVGPKSEAHARTHIHICKCVRTMSESFLAPHLNFLESFTSREEVWEMSVVWLRWCCCFVISVPDSERERCQEKSAYRISTCI